MLVSILKWLTGSSEEEVFGAVAPSVREGVLRSDEVLRVDEDMVWVDADVCLLIFSIQVEQTW